MRSSLLKLFTVERKVCSGILAHFRLRDFFNASVLVCAVAHASFFKMDQTQKSRGSNLVMMEAIIPSSRTLGSDALSSLGLLRA